MRPRTRLALITLALSFSAALPMCAEDVERVTLEPMPEEPVELQAFEVIGPTHPRYLEHTLGGFGLKPLAEEALAAGEERFRLLWLRSFHRAALFELRFAADGSGAYEAKLWEDTPDGGRWVVQRTVALGAKALTEHRSSLARLSFYALPFDDGRQGLDGATWLFETRDAERSHAVHRWSPEPGPLRELGVSLIEAAIKSDFLPIY